MLSLHIQLLGNFRLACGDTPVTNINTARRQSLLAYLVLHRDAPQSRQHLAFLFWPDSTEAQARTNLRNQLYHLRRALPDADRFLCANAKTLQWLPDAPITLDVADFDSAVAQAQQAEQAGDQPAVRAALERATALYRGELLPSCYDEWIVPVREQLYQTFLRTVERLTQLLETQRDYHAAIRYAQRLLQHDPLHEATYRRLMRLYALSDDRARALRVYHTCATVLQRELGTEPSAATREMYERLLNVEAQAEPRRRPPAALVATLPLVGRRQKWQQLQAAWREAARGRPHIVLVAGEAGIGKSRLAEELLEWAERQGIATARARSYAAEGELAYTPLVTWLRSEAVQPALPALEDVWLTELARLLPELLADRPDLSPPGSLTETWQRQRLFEALARAILAGSQPLLLVIDDLQWCDQETLEWLHYLLRFDPQARLLVVGTFRPEETARDHPLESLRLALRRSRQFTEMELDALDEAETATLAAHVAGRELPQALAARIYEETEGNPLFVVETVRAAAGDWRLETCPEPSRRVGDWEETSDAKSLISNLQSLPPGVQAVIQARLAQLSPSARDLAGLAATIGREFTSDVLARASDADEDALVRGLDELWQRRIVREQGADAYDFSHDKIREVAYAELSAARRRLLHRRVALALEAMHVDDLDAASGQVASHYERAGLPEQAIPYYQRAAEVAARVCANNEAADQLTRGLMLLETLPQTAERAEQELALQLALGNAFSFTRGLASPELGEAYARARVLCQRVGDTAERLPALWGLWAFHLMRAELQTARELGEELLRLAESEQDPTAFLVAHRALGVVLFYLGELAPARAHLEQAIARYDRHQHRTHRFLYWYDPGVACLYYVAYPLLFLGYPNQALERMNAALTLARELSHPISEISALGAGALFHMWRREGQATLEWAQAATDLSAEWGMPAWSALVTVIRGGALVEQSSEPGPPLAGREVEGHGQLQEEIARGYHSLAIWRDAGTQLHVPFFLAVLGKAYGKAGQPEEGLAALDEALAVARGTGERYYEAELHRLKGELLRKAEGGRRNDESGNPSPKACFRQAIDIARCQQAKLLELRAATSLSRLWQSQGRQAEACRLLTDIYDWFSEGF
ncbi:MAG: AAA family ATPase, partial [Anaerolineae bacterium]